MKREEFSFSGFEKAQAAINKAARPEVSESTGSPAIETDEEASKRVAKMRSSDQVKLQDLQISTEKVEQALQKPGFTTPTPAVADDYFSDKALHSPNQYAADHAVLDRAKQVRPASAMATQSARDEFGISPDQLFGSPDERLKEAQKEQRRLDDIRRREEDREMAQAARADAMVAPQRVSAEPARVLSLTEKGKLLLDAEQSLTFIQEETDRVQAELVVLNLKIKSLRETIEGITLPEMRQSSLQELQGCIREQAILKEQLDILKRSLAKKIPGYQETATL